MSEGARAVRVRVSALMLYEYEMRGLYPEIDSVGLIEVPRSVAVRMLSDAEFYTDRDGPDETPANVRKAYERMREQLRRVLA